MTSFRAVSCVIGLGHYSEADQVSFVSFIMPFTSMPGATYRQACCNASPQGKFVRLGSRNIYDQEGILLDSGSSLTGKHNAHFHAERRKA